MPSKDTADQLTLHTMRAAAIDRFGGPEVLSIHILPVPVLNAGEVLIAVHTAGVASWDADIRAGWFPSGRPRFPLVLGTDGVGTIAAVGSRIRRFHERDRVYSYNFLHPERGFYAPLFAGLTGNKSRHNQDNPPGTTPGNNQPLGTSLP